MNNTRTEVGKSQHTKYYGWHKITSAIAGYVE